MELQYKFKLLFRVGKMDGTFHFYSIRSYDTYSKTKILNSLCSNPKASM